MTSAAPPPSPRRRIVVATALLGATLVGGALELGGYLAGRVLQAKWAMYADPEGPPRVGEMTYQTYLAVRDPVLGWPRPDELGVDYDVDGAHWCRGSGVEAGARWAVSAYGDSFTADARGGDTDRWTCRLQRRLGARVRNYGVGGYGSDQALIRYLEHPDDRADVVMLAHMSDDIFRNLSRYRGFGVGRTWSFGFKPRFVLHEDGRLERLPIPRLSETELLRFMALEDPQLILQHEFFHPYGPSGATPLRFPYALAVLRNFGYWGLQVRLSNRPIHAPFYAPEHPARGTALTAAIMLEFARVARARGQRPVLAVFPGHSDLEHFSATGEWVYQGLLDALDAAGDPALHFGPPLLEHFEGRPITEAFGTGSAEARFHYGEEASHVVADTLFARLTATATAGAPRP